MGQNSAKNDYGKRQDVKRGQETPANDIDNGHYNPQFVSITSSGKKYCFESFVVVTSVEFNIVDSIRRNQIHI
jgi:hypothetical protein